MVMATITITKMKGTILYLLVLAVHLSNALLAFPSAQGENKHSIIFIMKS